MHLTVTVSLSWKQGTCSFTDTLYHSLSALTAFRKIHLLLHELCRGTRTFLRTASSPFAQMPTQIFWHHAGGTKKLWNLLFPRIYLKKKKKSTGSIHSQSSPRLLSSGRCFPFLDLATKGRKWKRNISGSFSRIYQKLKALFPLFLLLPFPRIDILYIASGTWTKSGS